MSSLTPHKSPSSDTTVNPKKVSYQTMDWISQSSRSDPWNQFRHSASEPICHGYVPQLRQQQDGPDSWSVVATTGDHEDKKPADMGDKRGK